MAGNIKARRTSLPQVNLWDVPPLPDHGDDDQTVLFAAVGKALSQWEYLEAYLGLIYGLFVGNTKPASPAMRAYGSIVGFNARQEMAKEASSAFFRLYFSISKDQIDLYRHITKAAKDYSPRRNDIAHGIVQPYVNPKRIPSGYALIPSRHATKKYAFLDDPTQLDVTSPKYAYTSIEIDMFARHFGGIANEAMNFFIWLHREMKR
jgi:hypothetical protein